MGKQFKTRCKKCGKPHVFQANSKYLEIVCKGTYSSEISGKQVFVKCSNKIVNKGFVPQPKTTTPRLKIKDIKKGKQTDIMGKRI